MSARARRRKGGKSNWKESKPLSYGLIGAIFILWAYMFWPTSRNIVSIPQAYMCAEDQTISTVTDMKGGVRLPMKCDKCGKFTAWEAYECNNLACADPNTGKAHVFAHVFTIPADMLDADGRMKAMVDPMEMGMMGGEGFISPTCPKCGLSAMINIEEYEITLLEGATQPVERYFTPEAREMIHKMEEEHRKRREERKKSR